MSELWKDVPHPRLLALVAAALFVVTFLARLYLGPWVEWPLLLLSLALGGGWAAIWKRIDG